MVATGAGSKEPGQSLVSEVVPDDESVGVAGPFHKLMQRKKKPPDDILLTF